MGSKNRSFIIHEKDIREYSRINKYSYITSIFTLQFMPKTDGKIDTRHLYKFNTLTYLSLQKKFILRMHISRHVNIYVLRLQRKHLKIKTF